MPIAGRACSAASLILALALLLPAGAALLAGAAHAQAPAPVPPGPSLREQMSPDEEQRLRKLEGELRCLVCQNQTLADSDASLAGDLRRQVETMVAEGRSNAEIKTYLVDRYGDFVLYRPPVQRNTLALWAGPFVLLGIGVLAWIMVQRRSRRARGPAVAQTAASSAPPQQSPEDRERIRRLLDD